MRSCCMSYILYNMHDRAVSPEQPIMACDKLVVGTDKASGLGHRVWVQIEVVAVQIWIEYSAVFVCCIGVMPR